MFLTGLILCYVGAASAIMGGQQAAPPEPDSAVVFVQKYGRHARVRGFKDSTNSYYSFQGIRFAETPTGRLRFARPQPLYLSGDLSAEVACQPCLQPHPYSMNKFFGDEDCLCLNIYAPRLPVNVTGSPVLLWVHGGGYRYGSASYYGGEHLVKKDTILVTVQYRLGSLGFLDTGRKDATGNVGLFDLAAALQWIRDYIEFFGGDNQRIVVWGQGSGASAASLLAMSSHGHGVRGVAALSGTPLSPSALPAPKTPPAVTLAKRLRCPHSPTHALINCLRSLPAVDIILADSKQEQEIVETDGFIQQMSGRLGVGARVEGANDRRARSPLVEYSPNEQLNNTDKSRRKLPPLLTGVTKDETASAIYGNFKNNIEKAQDIATFVQEKVMAPLKNLISDQISLGAKIGEAILSNNGKQLINLDSYYQPFKQATEDIYQVLNNIAQATGDALFNFPAYETSRLWSEKQAPAYLYSFEFIGNATRGGHFLPHSYLANGGHTENLVSHGDELAYLFEPLDAFGKPMETNPLSASEAKVRDHFTQLISDFAHAPEKFSNKAPKKSIFSTQSNAFIKIGSQIEAGDKFRFCEMALWGGLQQRLSEGECAFKSITSVITKPLDGLNNIASLANTNPLTSALQNPIGGTQMRQNADSSNMDDRRKPQPNNPLKWLG